jgi:hypothetical protein
VGSPNSQDSRSPDHWRSRLGRSTHLPRCRLHRYTGWCQSTARCLAYTCKCRWHCTYQPGRRPPRCRCSFHCSARRQCRRNRDSRGSKLPDRCCSPRCRCRNHRRCRFHPGTGCLRRRARYSGYRCSCRRHCTHRPDRHPDRWRCSSRHSRCTVPCRRCKRDSRGNRAPDCWSSRLGRSRHPLGCRFRRCMDPRRCKDCCSVRTSRFR